MMPCPRIWRRFLASDGWSLEYDEYDPPARLAGRVVCFWYCQVTGTPCQVRSLVLPDACVDVIFGWPCHIRTVGFMTESIQGFLRPGQAWGVRFPPQVLGAVIRDTPRCLVGRSATGCELPLPEGAQALAERLWELPHQADRLRHLVAWTQDVVVRHNTDRRIQMALDLLTTAPDRGIADLSLHLGVCARHLHRSFIDQVGPSPKLFAQQIRFLAALETWTADQNTSLVEQALDAGYSDQPHFNHAIRRFSGVSPVRLRRLLPGDTACPICTIPSRRRLYTPWP